MASHVLVADPNELSTRYSKKGSLGTDNSSVDDMLDGQTLIEEEDGPADTKTFDLDTIDRYLDRIPAREADFIRLYHRDKLKQEQIAKLFGITQAAVSYRLHRGIKRIQFLRTIPELKSEDFEREVAPMFEWQDKEILWRMYGTTCQSEIAKQLGLTQARVRHRFFRSLDKIRTTIISDTKLPASVVEVIIGYGKSGLPALDQDGNVLKFSPEDQKRVRTHYLSKYYTAYTAISDKHFCILHEVKIPQFSDRGDAVILPIE
jgi:DNA-directed RNA polymerase specialized sigma24 family protein